MCVYRESVWGTVSTCPYGWHTWRRTARIPNQQSGAPIDRERGRTSSRIRRFKKKYILGLDDKFKRSFIHGESVANLDNRFNRVELISFPHVVCILSRENLTEKTVCVTSSDGSTPTPLCLEKKSVEKFNSSLSLSSLLFLTLGVSLLFIMSVRDASHSTLSYQKGGREKMISVQPTPFWRVRYIYMLFLPSTCSHKDNYNQLEKINSNIL